MIPAQLSIRGWTLGPWCLLLALPAVLGAQVPGAAAGQPGGSWLPFLLSPLVMASSLVLFMTPGLCLAAGRPGAETPSGWLLRGFGLSLAVAIGVNTAAALIWGASLRGGRFGALALAVAAFAVLARGRQARPPRPPEPGTPGGAPLAVSLLVGTGMLAVLLAPKLLWEDFNGDGVHAFLSSRLLLDQGWPFWPPDVGPLAGFPGVTSMLFAWPDAWFLRLFGDTEASVRVPFLLYLPVAAAGILAIAEQGRPAAGRGTWFAVAVGLLPYTLAMAYSATYNPYHADIALPATQDTLLLICLLGWIHAVLRGEARWAAVFGVGIVTSLPSGPLLMGLWIVAHFVVSRPRPWSVLRIGAGTLAAALAVVVLLPVLLAAVGAPPPGDEYGTGILRRYFEYVQFTDWRRLAWVAVPAGLLPFLVLWWWPAQDATARGLTLLAAGYFGFFFVQAHVALHHFAPAMLVPVVVAARTVPAASQGRRAYLGTWLLLAAVALTLALPRRFLPHRTARQVGAAISQLVGPYPGRDPNVFMAAELLGRVVPPDWDLRVPDQSYGGSPVVWLHYARHGVADAATLAVLSRPEDLPQGFEILGTTGQAVLGVRDSGVVAAFRALRPVVNAGSPVLAVPRGVLWRGHPLPSGPRLYPTESLLRGLRRLLPGDGT